MTIPRLRLRLLAGLRLLATAAGTVLAGTANAAPAGLQGQDVSGYRGNVNWSAQYSAGSRFAHIKATEGTYCTNPYFAQQYNGSSNVGMIFLCAGGRDEVGAVESTHLARGNWPGRAGC